MKGRTFILSAIVLFAVTSFLSAAPPDWFPSGKRTEYPPDWYFIGVAKGASQEEALSRAQTQIGSQIESTVSADLTTYLESWSEQDREVIREETHNKISTLVNTKLKGAQVVDQARDGADYYVFLALDKDAFAKELLADAARDRKTLEQMQSSYKELKTEGRIFQALDVLLSMEDVSLSLFSTATTYTAVTGDPCPESSDDFSGPALLALARSELGKLNLEKISGDRQSGKRGRLLPEPLVVKAVFHEKGGDEIPIPNIRLKMLDPDGEVIEREFTNSKGVAEFFIYADGTDKEKRYVTLDLAGIPRVLHGDLKNLQVKFTYFVTDTPPMSFSVEIRDERGRPIDDATVNVAESVVKAGYQVSADAPFLLVGRIREEEQPKKIKGFSGTQYQVKSKLQLFLKEKQSGDILGNIDIESVGIGDNAERATEASWRKLKVRRNDMARLLGEAPDKLRAINEKLSTEALKEGKKYYDQGDSLKALYYLSRVVEGEAQVSEAQELIRKIKDEMRARMEAQIQSQVAQ